MHAPETTPSSLISRPDNAFRHTLNVLFPNMNMHVCGSSLHTSKQDPVLEVVDQATMMTLTYLVFQEPQELLMLSV